MIRIIDNAIEPNQLLAAKQQFPGIGWNGYHHYSGNDSEKYGSTPDSSLPIECKRAMELLRNICEDVIAAPHFADMDLWGSGLHRMEPGGYLRRHLDSSVHPHRGWERTHSCVLFASECSGGELVIETGDEHQTIRPAFNRLVIFHTTETAWHWVNDVTGELPRLSLSLFFWRYGKPADSTRMQARFQNFL